MYQELTMYNISIIAMLILSIGMIIVFVKLKKTKKIESEKYQFRKKRVLNKKIDFK